MGARGLLQSPRGGGGGAAAAPSWRWRWWWWPRRGGGALALLLLLAAVPTLGLVLQSLWFQRLDVCLATRPRSAAAAATAAASVALPYRRLAGATVLDAALAGLCEPWQLTFLRRGPAALPASARAVCGALLAASWATPYWPLSIPVAHGGAAGEAAAWRRAVLNATAGDAALLAGPLGAVFPLVDPRGAPWRWRLAGPPASSIFCAAEARACQQPQLLQEAADEAAFLGLAGVPDSAGFCSMSSVVLTRPLGPGEPAAGGCIGGQGGAGSPGHLCERSMIEGTAGYHYAGSRFLVSGWLDSGWPQHLSPLALPLTAVLIAIWLALHLPQAVHERPDVVAAACSRRPWSPSSSPAGSLRQLVGPAVLVPLARSGGGTEDALSMVLHWSSAVLAARAVLGARPAEVDIVLLAPQGAGRRSAAAVAVAADLAPWRRLFRRVFWAADLPESTCLLRAVLLPMAMRSPFAPAVLTTHHLKLPGRRPTSAALAEIRMYISSRLTNSSHMPDHGADGAGSNETMPPPLQVFVLSVHTEDAAPNASYNAVPSPALVGAGDSVASESLLPPPSAAADGSSAKRRAHMAKATMLVAAVATACEHCRVDVLPFLPASSVFDSIGVLLAAKHPAVVVGFHGPQLAAVTLLMLAGSAVVEIMPKGFHCPPKAGGLRDGGSSKRRQLLAASAAAAGLPTWEVVADCLWSHSTINSEELCLRGSAVRDVAGVSGAAYLRIEAATIDNDFFGLVADKARLQAVLRSLGGAPLRMEGLGMPGVRMDKAEHHLCVLVPFRESAELSSQACLLHHIWLPLGLGRWANLREFKRVIRPFLDKVRGEMKYTIGVIEQDQGGLFNQAGLFNAGYHILKDHLCDYFVFHDVDHVPTNLENTYDFPERHRHMRSCYTDAEGVEKELPYDDFWGAVWSLSKEKFEIINGYRNCFWGWGFEDEDIYMRLVGRFDGAERLPCKVGHYRQIPHPRVMNLDQTAVYKSNGQIRRGETWPELDGGLAAMAGSFEVLHAYTQFGNFHRFTVRFHLPNMPQELGNETVVWVSPIMADGPSAPPNANSSADLAHSEPYRLLDSKDLESPSGDSLPGFIASLQPLLVPSAQVDQPPPQAPITWTDLVKDPTFKRGRLEPLIIVQQ
eukprot:SM000022S07186  [mRNA]  locus=s22:394632:399866:+ [translate_table: standard]